eukprot:11663438-Alexandrium_andersonii.AAC.1
MRLGAQFNPRTPAGRTPACLCASGRFLQAGRLRVSCTSEGCKSRTSGRCPRTQSLQPLSPVSGPSAHSKGLQPG